MVDETIYGSIHFNHFKLVMYTCEVFLMVSGTRHDLKGEFTLFRNNTFLKGEFTFFLPPPSGLTSWNSKNSEVPDGSFGVREFTHRGSKCRPSRSDHDGRSFGPRWVDLQKLKILSGTSEFLSIPGGKEEKPQVWEEKRMCGKKNHRCGKKTHNYIKT